MAGQDERPSNGVCHCSCGCHDNGIGKAGSTVRILGSVGNSIDLYITTPPKTKWIFIDDAEKEVNKTLQGANRELCG